MRGNRIKVGVLGVLMVAGLAAAPLAADAGSELCPSGKVCIYVDPQYVGLLGWRSPGGGVVTVSASADNKTSSWENTSGTNAAWYTYPGGTGSCYNMYRYSQQPSIPWPNYDKLTSWRTDRAC